MSIDFGSEIVKLISQDGEVGGATPIAIGDDILLRHEYDEVVFEIANLNESQPQVALNNFILYVQAHAGGDWYALISAGAWTTSPVIKYLSTTGIATLAKGAALFGWLTVGPVYAIRFSATTASATAHVTVKGATRRFQRN